MGDLFLEQDFLDYLQKVRDEKSPELGNEFKKLQTNLWGKFMGLSGLEKILLFQKMEPELWPLCTRSEIANFRRELLGQACVGTKVDRVLHQILVTIPRVEYMNVTHPFFDVMVVGALADLAEMEHRLKLAAAQ